MSLRTILATAILIGTLATVCPAQERFETGSLKGFTKSPSEHIIDERNEPFRLHAVRGVVLDPSGAEMDGVIVEIRDEAGQIRGTKSNSKGRFMLSGTPDGTYKFKLTMDGFQSVVGNIVVSKKASKRNQMRIVMKAGV